MLRPACASGTSIVCGSPTVTWSLATSVPSTLSRTLTAVPGGEVGVEHAVLDALRLVQDGEARRAVEHDAAVVLALLAGDERVDRRIEAERRRHPAARRRRCRR